MRPYILAETNWKNVNEISYEIAILPWGATEAHNYHLPYSTDIIEGEKIAAESARKAWKKGAKVIVLPAVPFGVNTGQSDILLDLNINPSTQRAILDDLISVLNRQGIKKLLVLNSHGGNDFKPLLRELGLKFPEMFLCFSNWFQTLDRKKYFENNGDHADELETSLLLHLAPELVLPLNQAGSGKQHKFKIEALKRGWVWSERKWSKASDDTGIGNPEKASAEKGKKFFDDVTDLLVGFIVDLASADLNDLYEQDAD